MRKHMLKLCMVFVLCLSFCIPATAYDMARVSLRNTLSASDGVTAAIDTDNSLWMWGDNKLGQLGNSGIGNATDEEAFYWYDEDGNEHYDIGHYQTIPVKILDDVISVSTGSSRMSGAMLTQHVTAAIKSDKSLWVWGSGSLGNGYEAGQNGNLLVRHGLFL